MLTDIQATDIKQDFPPLMPWREFAEWVRVDVEICRGWCERGYLPTTRIGKHRLVNIVALVEELKGAEK